jgi:hypothetical protein
MKVWWILVFLLILVAMTLRESYTNYEEALKDVGQTAGYISLVPKCPEGSTLNSAKTMCTFSDPTKTDVIPKCSSKASVFVDGACRPNTGMTGGTSDTFSDPTNRQSNTTGGSSDTFSGPTNRQSTARGVFGPTFTGFGAGSGGDPHRDSTKSNSYPQLLGGGDSKPKTLVDGAGLVNPSKNWQLANDGSLPNCTSLGCDENSKYFPHSRQPGDMDLIPDPYRVSQSYMSSSHSFKTEPTPFLTDFSAFLR